MEILQEVATISGKPGLYRIVKPGRAGVIVESLDTEKKREMVSANARVSVLKEISVYTTDFNVSKPLAEIFMVLKESFPTAVDLDVKAASTADLFAFFEKIMPDFDKERVYPTDIKKIITWYNSLSAHLPEAFVTEAKS
jgi:Domain of unknown function (DUF5606)